MKQIEILALVDDDDTFVFITQRIIEQTNHVKEIKVFNNGLDALNYLKNNLNNDYQLPEVIFLDLSMPIMDGWQFLDEFTSLSLKTDKTEKILIYILVLLRRCFGAFILLPSLLKILIIIRKFFIV